ncbi:MAG: FAD-dependent oxidoreductase [Lentisphaeria bacterium]|nr:FAD-dependent oxidoreductase [Lentisphaeria bacterium]
MREITGQVASIALEHDKEKPVVIIGSGLAGYTLARELRRLNEEQKIVIVTKDDGAYYPKPKLSTALAENKSSDDLVHKTASEMEEDLNISVKTFSWVEEIKPSEQAIIVNGESIPYHKLVVASGARPRDIGLQGDGAKDVLRINNLSDYRKFRDQLSAGDHVFIIGAGLIGCEFMNDLNHAGYQVSICDPSEAPLASLIPTEVGQDLANFYSERGISFYMKTAVASIDKTENGYVVELESGESIEVNLVLSAVGLVANTGLVKAAGIHTEKGIVVNEHLQSSDEHIYALGDCVQIDGRLLPYIAPINHAAKAIAQSLTGEQKEVSFPVMPVQIKTTQFPILVLGFSDPKKPWEIKRTEDGILAQQLNDDQKIIAAVLVKAATKELQAIIKQMN